MAPWHFAWPRRRGNGFIAAAFAAVLAIGVFLHTPVAGAAPYIPAGDGVVLATVAAPALAQRDQIRALSTALNANPADADSMSELALIYLDIYAETGDPRYLGYADNLLAKAPPVPPVAVQLLQARVAQAAHRFDEAQQLLATVLAEQPDNVSAVLMAGSLAMLRGDYAAARRACASLIFAGRQDLAGVCAAELASLGGDSLQALEQLEALLPGLSEPAVAAWARQVAVDIAMRLDKPALAAAHARQALAMQPKIYNALQLADVLIADGDIREAQGLLQTQPPSDAVVLRRARVALMLDASDADAAVQLAQQRIDNIRRRGDTSHAREEAYYELYLAGDADAALEASERNWQTQRERIDAEIFLAAAVRAGNADAAAPVLSWLEQTASDDQQLLLLAGRLQ